MGSGGSGCGWGGGVMACDGEWPVVVGRYLLLSVFIGCCSVARLIISSFPFLLLPFLDLPSFTYGLLSSTAIIVRFIFHSRPLSFLDLTSFTHGLVSHVVSLVSWLLSYPPIVS